MPYELSDEEYTELLNVATPVLQDREGSFWKWDHSGGCYRILDHEGKFCRTPTGVLSPGTTRANINELYGPTKLVSENLPLQKAVAGLFQGLRNSGLLE